MDFNSRLINRMLFELSLLKILNKRESLVMQKNNLQQQEEAKR